MTEKILVVDDSATIREQLRRVLAPAGFEVIEASDGVDGLRQLESHPDVAMIVCDVHMPRMDGLVMVETVRRGPFAGPILMLTTEGQPDLIRRAKSAGARGWIIKPFEASLLLMAVQKLVAVGAG